MAAVVYYTRRYTASVTTNVTDDELYGDAPETFVATSDPEWRPCAYDGVAEPVACEVCGAEDCDVDHDVLDAEHRRASLVPRSRNRTRRTLQRGRRRVTRVRCRDPPA
jgi:hypothetical protein